MKMSLLSSSLRIWYLLRTGLLVQPSMSMLECELLTIDEHLLHACATTEEYSELLNAVSLTDIRQSIANIAVL